MSFASKLRILRNENKMTQEEVAAEPCPFHYRRL